MFKQSVQEKKKSLEKLLLLVRKPGQKDWKPKELLPSGR